MHCLRFKNSPIPNKGCRTCHSYQLEMQPAECQDLREACRNVIFPNGIATLQGRFKIITQAQVKVNRA
jgi:hypothetical protein